MIGVDDAYAEVQRLTRARAKNFAYGIMVLPREKRRAIAAVYAFAREVDDIADGALPDDEKRARLEELRAALAAAPVTAMQVALADARARFDIPDDALSALVDGGLQDLEQTLYATFDDLRALLRFEAERAAALLRAGDVLRAQIGGRLGRAVGLFARGGLAALDALEAANWDLFTQRPKPSRARLMREAALVLVR